MPQKHNESPNRSPAEKFAETWEPERQRRFREKIRRRSVEECKDPVCTECGCVIPPEPRRKNVTATT